VFRYFRQLFRNVKRWWGGEKEIKNYKEIYYLQSIAPKVQQLQSGDLETDWYLKGEEFMRSCNYKKASFCFERVLQITPRHAGALSCKGYCLYKLANIKAALDCFLEALVAHPKDADLLVNCGNCYCHLQDYNKAIQYYEKASEYDDSPVIWNNIGYCLVCLKRERDACFAYQKALDNCDNEDADILGNAAATFLRSGSYNEAMYIFDRCLQLTPEDHLLLNNVAVYLAFRNCYPQALKCCEKAIALEPNPNYLCNKGMLLLEMGVSDYLYVGGPCFLYSK
jgi:tetratricopeptide (TPR) repeat protein